MRGKTCLCCHCIGDVAQHVAWAALLPIKGNIEGISPAMITKLRRLAKITRKQWSQVENLVGTLVISRSGCLKLLLRVSSSHFIQRMLQTTLSYFLLLKVSSNPFSSQDRSLSFKRPPSPRLAQTQPIWVDFRVETICVWPSKVLGCLVKWL